MTDKKPLLSVEGLTCEYRAGGGRKYAAVDRLSFSVYPGETVALVGESGCGKTAAALCVTRLIEHGGGRITGGRIMFRGEDLAKKTKKEMRGINGKRIGMIFQEPMTSLNPVLTVGYQITEVLGASAQDRERGHPARTEADGAKTQDIIRRGGNPPPAGQDTPAVSAREAALEMLRRVGIDNAEKYIDRYPFQLSGGQRQRVMIAIALCQNPDLLIADEPTSALDVTVQAQILDLLSELKKSCGMTTLVISHDLGVVAHMADRVAVMYAGQLAEQGTAQEIFENPLHPYTRGLLKAVPSVSGEKRRLYVIPGIVPVNYGGIKGCRFAERCEARKENCGKDTPPLVSPAGGDGGTRQVRCFHV